MPEQPAIRMTHEYEGELVVFLIGMRINKPWRPDLWLPVFSAMPRMLAELSQDPDSGLIGYRLTFGSGGPVVVQYWNSHEKLYAYASAPTPSTGRRGRRSIGGFGRLPARWGSGTRRTWWLGPKACTRTWRRPGWRRPRPRFRWLAAASGPNAWPREGGLSAAYRRSGDGARARLGTPIPPESRRTFRRP